MNGGVAETQVMCEIRRISLFVFRPPVLFLIMTNITAQYAAHVGVIQS
jgi:hypothetical protein